MKQNIEDIKKILPLIYEYLDKGLRNDSPVVQYLDQKRLRKKLDLSIGYNGTTFEKILKEIRKYINFSVNTSHSQFFNQLFSGFNLPAFIGDVFSALTNTTMATYEAAPVATLIEEYLVKKMCKLMGIKDGDGIFVSGGSQANIVATLCARNRIAPKIKKSGYYKSKHLVMFVSDQSHYSFNNAANILGIGTNNIIKIRTDSYGRMIPNKLEIAIDKKIKEGSTPFFIGATAGTTVLGAFDPLQEIARIAKEYNVWFHIDACFGGSVILSSKYKYLLSGCEHADSIAWDPHKMMCIPLICSVILVKDRRVLYETCSTTGANYLFHAELPCDLGVKSLQCARRVDALKLWLSWKFHGDRGYDRIITNLFDLAEYATQFIDAHERLELVAPRNTVSICFRYLVKKGIDINRFNIMLRDELHKTGKCLVNYASIKGRIAIRLTLSNPNLSKRDVDQFFKNLLTTAEEIENNWKEVIKYRKRKSKKVNGK